MLHKPENDMFHLLTILESIGKIQVYLKTIETPEEFIQKDDQLYFNASLTLLAGIGEVFGKLSEQSQKFFDKEDLIGVKSIRNRIVHDYTGIDSFRIYEIINNHLPKLSDLIVKLFKNYLEDSTFDQREYEVSKESTFYKHIPFNLIG